MVEIGDNDNETVELVRNEAALKTLKKEMVSAIIQVELDVRHNVGVKDSKVENVNLCKIGG